MRLEIPDGYRIVFWIETLAGDLYAYDNAEADLTYMTEENKTKSINSMKNYMGKRYSNISLNEDGKAYCTIFDKTVKYDMGDGEKEYYLIGLEDVKRIDEPYLTGWGEEFYSDNDCNDIVLALEATNVYVVDTQPGDDKESIWTLAYEDMGGIGDFDFNDVVLQLRTSITYDVVGKPTYLLNLRLMATGGVLPIWLFYKDPTSTTPKYICIGSTNNDGTIGKIWDKDIKELNSDEELSQFGDYELHHLLNPKTVKYTKGDISYPMLNTYSIGIKDEKDNKPGKILNPILVPHTFSLSWEAKDFVLVVRRSDGVCSYVTLPYRDTENPTVNVKAPQGFCCATGFKWVYETTPVTEVYTEFRRWINNGTAVAGYIGWFNTLDEAISPDNKTSSGYKAFPDGMEIPSTTTGKQLQ
ncbi:hypothetical protein [uncultured Bacteroides sp.]|uniref:hypothetical protein n=1 Tax=uncultured Bacteroides sp. TaxID=162156 RepID=UPI002610EF97|nr:hypothetical protein [uncultured Bacteroides sp.]